MSRQDLCVCRGAADRCALGLTLRTRSVTGVLKQLKMTRKELAAEAKVTDFRQMNYWIRGKDTDLPQVAEMGDLVYAWAKSKEPLLVVDVYSRSSSPPTLEPESSQESLGVCFSFFSCMRASSS